MNWCYSIAMKHASIIALLLLPLQAFALTYSDKHLPYSDAPADVPTRVALSLLTELGTVQGNPDGTFRPNRTLNRAEFMEVTARLLPPYKKNIPISAQCFPDVLSDAWYMQSVCLGKQLGIVRGNAVDGVPEEQWLFAPERSVQYEEGLKILFGIFEIIPDSTSGPWYEPYTSSAQDYDLHIADAQVGRALTRGQMARLVAGFVADDAGELDEFRDAQSGASFDGVYPERSRRAHDDITPSSASSTSSPSSVSSISSVSSASSVSIDPLIQDTSTDDSVLVLGDLTNVLGAAELFSNAEPIIVQEFLIDLVAANSSIDALNVYDHDGIYIGRASLDGSVAGNVRYKLSAKNKNIVAPYRDDFSFYVRGVLRDQDAGGMSGGSVQVDRMGIAGVGEWSSRSYEQFTSGETFAESTVARSAISGIRNAGSDRDFLISGNDQEIGAFFFQGVTGHSSARLKITGINFTIGAVGGVSLSNVTMKVDGGSDRHSCTILGSMLSCSSLPDSFGRIDDGSRVLRIFADISVPSSSQSAGLQLSINDPGTIGSPGDITWSDGVSTFTFIDTGSKPLARGTYYSY